MESPPGAPASNHGAQASLQWHMGYPVQGTALEDSIPTPSGILQHHLLVAPASTLSTSKAVRWLTSWAVPPAVPGLSLVLAARCRDSPTRGLVTAVSRDEEGAWKRSRTETQCLPLRQARQCPSRAAGVGGTGGPWGTQTQDAFVSLPAGARGGRGELPAGRGATAGPGPRLPARPDKKGWRGGGRGHESKRRPLARRRQLAGWAAPDYSTGHCLLEINNLPPPPPSPSMPGG